MCQHNLTKLLWFKVRVYACIHITTYVHMYVIYICIYTWFWCPCNILFSVGGSSGDGDDVITVVMIVIVAVMVICAI